MLTYEMNDAARRLADRLAQRKRRPHGCNGRIVPPQWNQDIADRKAAPPDRLDHRMTGIGG